MTRSRSCHRKARFPSREAAETRLVEIAGKGDGDPTKPTATYQCTVCRHWHLTSATGAAQQHRNESTRAARTAVA